MSYVKRNVIALACYRRPELVKIHLECLIKCKELSEYYLMFVLDHGYHQDMHTVIAWFKTIHPHVIVIERTGRLSLLPAAGNILFSYIDALEYAKEYVIPAEEDILPSADYLRFNDYCYRNFLSKYSKIFCVGHKRREEVETKGDTSVLIGDNQCPSPSCVSVEAIEKYMVPHILNKDFMFDPVRYNSKYFLQSRISPGIHYNHDGQIERIIDCNGMFAIKPDQSRASHVGFYSTMIGKELEGTLEEKVKSLKETIFDINTVHKLNKPYEEAHGHKVAVSSLEDYQWSSLKLDVDRTLSKGSKWWYDNDNRFKQHIDTVNRLTQ